MLRVTGAIESFLGRITIDDRLRLVPDAMRIEENQVAGPSGTTHSPPPPDMVAPTHQTPSPLPTTPVAMDEDPSEPEVLSITDTETTSEVPEVRMEAEPPFAIVVPESPAPEPEAIVVDPPAINLIAATLQGSQELVATSPTPIPPVLPRGSLPPDPQPGPPITPPVATRGRSRTPAIQGEGSEGSRLGVHQGPTTRARSRSKTPI